MTAVRSADVEGVLRRPDPRTLVYLIYGPDSGLVSERAKKLAEGAVDDPADPFQLVRLEGDAVASDPGRLSDEAGTIGLFGGRRAVWVKAGGRSIAPAVEAVLDGSAGGALVVIEASDLAKSAALRVVCERSPKALALPCYPDDNREIEGLVAKTFRDAGLSLSPDARAVLLHQLGRDRLATRRELEKLLLYAHGAREVTADDVEAILADVSSLAIDAVVDAAFAGDAAELEMRYRRLSEPAATVLNAALRHALALIPARLEVEAGRPSAGVVEGWRGLNRRRKAAIERHLKRWTSTTLKDALARLQASLLDTRLQAGLADTIAARTLLEIAARRWS